MKTKIDRPSNNGRAAFSLEFVLRNLETGVQNCSCLQKQVICSQGDFAGSIFYICKGWVRLTVFSHEGKAATIAVLGEGDFVGEECLTQDNRLRLATAVAITDCGLLQIEKEQMLAALDSNRILARFFTQYLLTRKIRAQEDLADRLSHSSEKRLIRLLLLLAGSAPVENEGIKHAFPEISHEILAEMVGTTRPRISYFMNKLRKMGLVDYTSGIQVRKELEKLLE